MYQNNEENKRCVIGIFFWNKVKEWQKILKNSKSEKEILSVLQEIKRIPVEVKNYSVIETKND